jgi:bifunctional UDP-N-acetylglucosamine pyrophosphorylase/glucosamine-1-phosphate N-acetyltransferase
MEQRGTGHALLCAREYIEEGSLLVVPGDTPLICADLLAGLVAAHEAAGADATVLTMRPSDPTGYGRVIRGADGFLDRIVEHRDAGIEELRVDEVNSGMYVLPGPRAVDILAQASPDNAQGEIYLTDVVQGLRRTGGRVAAHMTADADSVRGVNTRVELAAAQDLMRRRLLEHWMLEGVTIEDPASTYIDSSVELEADVLLLPFTSLRGRTRVAGGSVVGPGSTLVDTRVAEGCTVRHSYTDGAVLEAGSNVGPFAYLRPEAHLMEKAKAGAFVEVKKSTIGPGSKVPHLSYIGDATIGRDTNVGAGNITANYDGKRKHPTLIGDNVHTGSDVVFVAPVTIGNETTIGAGSIITRDVPDRALGIARCRQKNIPSYADRLEQPGEAEDNGD